MPNSMTGFGQASVSGRDMSVDVIVRCVNGKHLKTKMHLGINMPAVAERIGALVAKYVRRGSVDVAVRLDWSGAGGVAFNERVITSYVQQLKRITAKLGLPAEIRAEQVAMLPGAVMTEGVSVHEADRVWAKIRPVVREALDKMVRMRASEGRKLAAELKRACSRMGRLLKRIESRIPKAGTQYRERLTARVSALMEDAGSRLEPGSLAREIIMFAERADISEELCRMRAHIDHCVEALGVDGSGRKLEFIAQEMHREANTMASKASDPVMTELIIDLRGEVDRIREQVLNLE